MRANQSDTGQRDIKQPDTNQRDATQRIVSPHIAIFARAPVPGAAKTRLMPALGAEGAAQAQQLMTMRALHTASTAAPGQVSLWTAGDPAHPFFAECANRFSLRCHAQEGADLGERMAHCLHTLLADHSAVLLIGTDCPALTAPELQETAQALGQEAQMVFTPAEDGGYVLVGARADVEKSALRNAFCDIDWSTEQVMAQTRRQLSANGWRIDIDWHEMPSQWDVDLPAHYARACAAGLFD